MDNGMKRTSRPLVIGLLFAISGCSDREAPSVAELPGAPSPGAPSPAATDRWLGRWNGPEGTFLLLEGGNGTYEVTIQNLDGPRRFQGTTVGEQIEFDRDGVTESYARPTAPPPA